MAVGAMASIGTSWTAPPRAPIRRMRMSRPGELVQVDIKRLGRIPKWPLAGPRPSGPATAVSEAFDSSDARRPGRYPD